MTPTASYWIREWLLAQNLVSPLLTMIFLPLPLTDNIFFKPNWATPSPSEQFLSGSMSYLPLPFLLRPISAFTLQETQSLADCRPSTFTANLWPMVKSSFVGTRES